jgi:hypothetical protein
MAFTIETVNVTAEVDADGNKGFAKFLWFIARKSDGDLEVITNTRQDIPPDYVPAQKNFADITEADCDQWVRDLFPEADLEAILDQKLGNETSRPAYSSKPWEDMTSSYPLWVNAHAYQIGDVVSYITKPDEGLANTVELLYECVQGHTSQTDWTPPTTPALWTPYTPSGVIAQWVQPTGAQDAYDIGDQVWWDYNAQGIHLWESNTAANVWEPGVFGWDDLGPYTP